MGKKLKQKPKQTFPEKKVCQVFMKSMSLLCDGAGKMAALQNTEFESVWCRHK